MKKWSLVSIALVVSLLASTTFWVGTKPKVSLVETSTLAFTPDFFLQGVNARRFNEAGNIIEKVVAQEIKHYDLEAGILFLTFPKITKYQIDTNWTISANSGNILIDSNDITLSEMANAVKGLGSNEQIILTADTIKYIDKKQILTSVGNASLHSAQEHIQADEITAFFKSNTLDIKGSVRGSHETLN